jgi:O-antigen/teichoic acid export membrane protein
LDHFSGESAVGLFSAAASVQAGGTLLMTAFGQSVTPKLARLHKTGDSRAFMSIVFVMIAWASAAGTLLVLTAVVVGYDFLRLLFGPEYAEHQVAFVWLSISAALWYVTSALGYAATAAEQIRIQPFALLIVLGTGIAACAYFVPIYGIRGAAVSSCISALIACLLYAAACIRAVMKMRYVYAV